MRGGGVHYQTTARAGLTSYILDKVTTYIKANTLVQRHTLSDQSRLTLEVHKTETLPVKRNTSR